MRARLARRLAALLVLLALAGCGGANGASEPPIADYARARAMAAFYESYLKENANQPPRDEQAFRAYLSSKSEDLRKAGLMIENMFASPRDGQPLKWVYAKPSRSQIGPMLLAYEAQPSDGKRLVITSGGMIDVIDEKQFRTLFPNAR